MYTVALSWVAATVLNGVVIAVCQWLIKKVLLLLLLLLDIADTVSGMHWCDCQRDVGDVQRTHMGGLTLPLHLLIRPTELRFNISLVTK